MLNSEFYRSSREFLSCNFSLRICFESGLPESSQIHEKSTKKMVVVRSEELKRQCDEKTLTWCRLVAFDYRRCRVRKRSHLDWLIPVDSEHGEKKRIIMKFTP